MEIIERLEDTKGRTLKYFGLGEDDLSRSYAAGKWTVRFILHHLADAETVLYDRVRRVICEPKQVIWAFDQDRWAADYSRTPLGLSRRIYDAVRDSAIYQARQHYEKSGHLEFVHSEAGIRTLRAEFDKIAAHNEHHLTQIETALTRRSPS